MKEAILSWLYPNFCVHCQALHKEESLLCHACSEHIEWIEPSYEGTIQGALLVPCGPIMSLVHHKTQTERVTKALGALFVIGLARYTWPMPDYVMASPYLETFGLAKAVARWIDRPLVSTHIWHRRRLGRARNKSVLLIDTVLRSDIECSLKRLSLRDWRLLALLPNEKT